MEKQNNNPLVNIRTVIRSKNPKLERYMPSFVIRYLEKILHQEDVNHILRSHGHLRGAPMASAALGEMRITTRVHGLDQIPLDGRYIFVSNHPLGGLDGLTLIKAIGQQFPDIYFVVNDLLMYLYPFKDIFIPVNKHGRQSQDYAKMINDAYDSPSQIVYFPAGLCSRKIKGEITDLPWKRNVLQKAVKHERDIIPVYFSGRNSNFFYRLANIRKALRIPFNIEMVYLIDESFRLQGSTFDIYFGKPIPYATFNSQKSMDQWTQEVRQQVYALPQQYDK